jgi:Tol biopolymer transport system component
MKVIRNFILLIILSVLFLSCYKEYSYEGAYPASAGSLTKDAMGNCLPVNINGNFNAGVPLTRTNYIDVSVDVTMAGSYSITTDTLNGIYFNAAHAFPATGMQTVRLAGHGTPDTSGVFFFTVHYNNNASCTLPVKVSVIATDPAILTIDCTAGSYTSPRALGVYVAGYPLDDSDKLVIFVQAASVGNYTLSTPTVNGFGFSTTGTFTHTGGQYVTLNGHGTPVNTGITTLSVSGVTVAGCDFSVTVNPRDLSTSKMYYNVKNPNGSVDIYSSNADGTNEKRLTNFSVNGTLPNLATQFSFNEDSTKLIFVLEPDIYGGNLMSMNVDGSGNAPFAAILGNKIHVPYVFQNGQKLVFCVDTLPLVYGYYPTQIFTANIDGTNLMKLTSVVAGNGLPDGACAEAVINKADNTFIYTRAGLGTTDIYGMNTDGSNKHPIAVNQLLLNNPQSSPDGSKIVFNAQYQPVNNIVGDEIFIMNADGSNITQLTNYSHNWTMRFYATLPVFSKDGKYIYYCCDESGLNQIYRMKIDGTGIIKITGGALERIRPLVN